ncbi:hypothetical protein GW866_07180 [bacterium]|nr:hypothetical protein [bacterium]
MKRTRWIGCPLAAEAARRDTRFTQFAKVAQSLTEQFWEQHYPGGDLAEVGSDYYEQRRAVGEMAGLIEGELRQTDGESPRQAQPPAV